MLQFSWLVPLQLGGSQTAQQPMERWKGAASTDVHGAARRGTTEQQ